MESINFFTQHVWLGNVCLISVIFLTYVNPIDVIKPLLRIKSHSWSLLMKDTVKDEFYDKKTNWCGRQQCVQHSTIEAPILWWDSERLTGNISECWAREFFTVSPGDRWEHLPRRLRKLSNIRRWKRKDLSEKKNFLHIFRVVISTFLLTFD